MEARVWILRLVPLALAVVAVAADAAAVGCKIDTSGAITCEFPL